MLLDLVSPWATAVESSDAPRACAAFRARHAELLEALRRQRAPLAEELPLATDVTALRALAAGASDTEQLQRLRDSIASAARLGADAPVTVVLLAGHDAADAGEPIPYPDAIAALFLDRSADESALITSLARALSAITRWRVPESKSPLRTAAARGAWDRWMFAREVPLEEWLYTEGIGLHLAHAILPELEPHQLLGTSRGAFHRLRERERVLRELLAADLQHAGINLVLRWLSPDAPGTARVVGEMELPPMAGRYLAWRMTAERVERVGLSEALRASV